MKKEITIHGKYVDSNNNYYAVTEGIRFIYKLSCEMNKSLKWYDKVKITRLSTYSSTCGDIIIQGRKRSVYYFLMLICHKLNNKYTILF